MQIEISHKHLSTEAEMRANAVAVRKRLMGGKPKPVKAPPRVVMRLPTFDEIPQHDHDAHVRLRDLVISGDVRLAVSSYVEARCRAAGRSFKEYRSGVRKNGLDAFRREITWDVYETFPKASYVAIGAALNRDHTTIIQSLQRIARGKGFVLPHRQAPLPNEEQLADFKAFLDQGLSIAYAEKLAGLNRMAGWKIANARGWVKSKKYAPRGKP